VTRNLAECKLRNSGTRPVVTIRLRRYFLPALPQQRRKKASRTSKLTHADCRAAGILAQSLFNLCGNCSIASRTLGPHSPRPLIRSAGPATVPILKRARLCMSWSAGSVAPFSPAQCVPRFATKFTGPRA
jgi:hypothetical protein